MAHREQKRFCKRVRRLFPEFFRHRIVIDVGSLDINGNNRGFFHNCYYKGIDICDGKNVDVVGQAHEKIPELCNDILRAAYRGRIDLDTLKPVDVMISTEMLEHDKFWKISLKTMYDFLHGGGLMIVTCAGVGRFEHGTHNNHAGDSPLTNDYYCNLSNEMFGSVLRPDMFDVYYLAQHRSNNDLQFYGIKKLKSIVKESNYQQLNKTA